MWWSDRPVLVTGCTGFLGSWLTRVLLERGASVVGLVRDRVPQSLLIQEGLIDRITVVNGAIEDAPLLARVLNEYDIDTVFHLAAQTQVELANRHPTSTFGTNIMGTWNLLESCRQVRCVQRIVVASSDKAYGTQSQLPYNESTPLEGRHPYDVSKSCTDLLALAYAATYRLPVCITRSGNFYGGGDLNFHRVIPGTIRSILHDQVPVIRSDGRYVRDYIYIADVVEAYLLLAEQMLENELIGEAFNLSAECRLSVLELVERILRVMDRATVKPSILNEAEGEIIEQYLTGEKARDRLGWSPSTSVDDGLQQTVAWYRQYFEKIKLGQISPVS